MQQFQRNVAGTHQPDTHPFCHNLTRECQPGWKLMSKKSTNESFIILFCWATSPEERFSWFVNDEVTWKYRHCFVWIKIWLLEKGGYSLTQKNNIILYLRNIGGGHNSSHGMVVNCKTIPRRGRTAMSKTYHGSIVSGSRSPSFRVVSCSSQNPRKLKWCWLINCWIILESNSVI